MFLIFRQVSGSNLGRDKDFPEVFRGFPQSRKQNFGTLVYLKFGNGRFLPLTSPFTMLSFSTTQCETLTPSFNTPYNKSVQLRGPETVNSTVMPVRQIHQSDYLFVTAQKRIFKSKSIMSPNRK
jgi:hypothetical protein